MNQGNTSNYQQATMWSEKLLEYREKVKYVSIDGALKFMCRAISPDHSGLHYLLGEVYKLIISFYQLSFSPVIVYRS